MTLAELQDAFAALGEPKFRAKQVFAWLHRGAVSFEAMTNLSKPLRETLDSLYFINKPTVARKQISRLDGTIKYLWRLRDGNCVESVVMQYHHGNTVCISSEVGCPMGCKFCASTIGGLVRRLEPSELLDQVLFSQLDSGLAISNIVLMGIGEPLDNFDNVMRFLELVNSPDGMSMAFLTLSMVEIFHSFNMRSRKGSIFHMKHQNKYLWGAMALSFVLTSAVIYIPVLSSAFGFERISALEYDVAIGLGLLVIPAVEISKWIRRKFA
mgnify:CR=1 FL=1